MNREDFPLFQQDTSLVYLDSAASTQKPQAVLNAMDAFYTTSYANVHRGLYNLSEQATQQYEAVRDQTQKFVNAKQREEIIFTSGTTASINLLAYSLGELLVTKDSVIVLSPADHHSNIVPWQMLAERKQATIRWLEVDSDMRIVTDNLEAQLAGAALVSFGHISNSLGTVQPYNQIITAAKALNIPVVLDAAQSAPHQQLDVQALDCDFLVFSAHKMCGPTGVGVLYAKHDWLERMPAWQGGGDMITTVTTEGFTAAELPAKFEAGTPNIAGVIGFGAALSYLQTTGLKVIEQTCDELYTYLLDQLATIPQVTVLGVGNRALRKNVASFTIQGVHPHDVADILNNQHNVSIRAGHHCAQPTMQALNVPSTARASVYFYNAKADIDALVAGLQTVINTFK